MGEGAEVVERVLDSGSITGGENIEVGIGIRVVAYLTEGTSLTEGTRWCP